MIAELAHELRLVAKAIHDNNVKLGWRGTEAPPRTFGDDIALLHSEVSEMLEAYRDHGIAICWETPRGHKFEDEHQSQPRKPIRETEEREPMKPIGVGSECADVFIRLMDTCHEYGIDLGAELEAKMKYNQQRSFRHGGKRL